MADGSLNFEILGDASRVREVVEGARRDIVNGMREAARQVAGIEIRPNLTGARDIAAQTSAIRAATAAISLSNLLRVAEVAQSIAESFAAMTQAAVEFGSRLDDASAKTGLAADRLLFYSEVATQAGISLEKFTGIYDRFLKQLDAAARNPAGDLARSLRALGIDARDALRDPQTAFDQLTKTIADLESPADRVRVSFQLFGRAGAELLPFFDQLAQSGEKVSRIIDDIGRDKINRFASEAAKLGDEIDLLNTKLRASGIAAGQQFLPAIRVALRESGNLLFDSGEKFNGFRDLGVKAFLLIAATANQFIKQLREVSAAIDQIRRGEFTEAAASVGRAFAESTIAAIREEYRLLRALLDAELSKPLEVKPTITTPGIAGLSDNIRAQTQAINQQAQQQVRDLERSNQNIEAGYRASRDRLQREFDARLISEREYTSRLEVEAEKRRVLLQANFVRELEISQRARLRPDQISDVSSRVRDRQADADRELNAERERIASESRERLRRAEEQHQNEIFRLGEIARQRRLEQIQQAVSDYALSQEEGERRITEIQIEAINERIRLAQKEVADAGANIQLQNIAKTRLEQLEAEKTRILDQGVSRRNGARQRDLREQLQYEETLLRIRSDAARTRIETLASVSGNELEAIRQRAALERQTASEEFALIERRLRAQLEASKILENDDIETARTKLENQRRISEELIAEAERRRARIEAIDRREQVDTERATPNSNRNLLGNDFADALEKIEAALGRQLTLWEQVRLKASLELENLKKTALTAAQAVKLSFGNIQGAVKSGIDAYVSSGGSLRAAGAAIYQALAAPWIEYAKQQAVLHATEAIASLSYGDFKGFALHTAAAAGFALLGAGATRLGNAIAGAGSAATGGQLGNQLTGTNADTRPTEDRVRFRDGNALGASLTITLVTDQAQTVKNVERGVTESVRQGGVVKQVLDNHLQGIPVG